MVLCWLKMCYNLAMDHGNDRNCSKMLYEGDGRGLGPSILFPAAGQRMTGGAEPWPLGSKTRGCSLFRKEIHAVHAASWGLINIA